MADINTDSDDDMPHGWEERVTVNGQVFYACHESQKTQWTHPVTGKRKKVVGDLPFGWERKIGDSGYVYFVDHTTDKTTFTDPRLAFAIEDNDNPGDISSLRQKFDAHSEGLQVVKGQDLSGKYAVITGGNAGLGKETARTLALAGCTVVLACRNVTAAEETAKSIRDELAVASVKVMQLNLASLHSVKRFAQEYIDNKWPLNILILNAAVLSPPHTITEDGLELCFQVNHLAHHYLARLLEPALKSSAPARVVVLSSESHRNREGLTSAADVNLPTLSPLAVNYHGLKQYGATKLLNIAFANAFNRRQARFKVFANSLHPGNMVNTSLSRNWWGYRLLFTILQFFTKSLQQGVATGVFVATSPDLDCVGGMYFNHCWVCEPDPLTSNEEFVEAVWELTEKTIQDKMGQDAFELTL